MNIPLAPGMEPPASKQMSEMLLDPLLQAGESKAGKGKLRVKFQA